MIYEYKCASCDHKWEVEQKVNDPKITTCANCNQETAKRLISKSTFQLKGGGWFKEGY